jgi:hypothetical protein
MFKISKSTKKKTHYIFIKDDFVNNYEYNSHFFWESNRSNKGIHWSTLSVVERQSIKTQTNRKN